MMNTMYSIKSFPKIKFLFIVLALEGIKCTIDGSFSKPRQNNTKTGDDPCNPLYWYPKDIPEYCNFRKMATPTPPGPDMPIPIPIPVPLPPPPPIPMPVLPPPVVPPLVMPPHVMPPTGPPPPIMVPHPLMPLSMPLPFGIPLAPTNPMVPVAGIPLPPPMPIQPSPLYPMPYPPQYPQPYAPPYPPHPSPFPAPISAPMMTPMMPPMPAPYPPPYAPSFPSPFPVAQRIGIGMVPGITGLVSPDGGINIMPFSDAYADMLQNHKQKMIRKRLQKIINEYDGHPWKSRRKTRRHGGREDNKDKLDENTLE